MLQARGTKGEDVMDRTDAYVDVHDAAAAQQVRQGIIQPYT